MLKPSDFRGVYAIIPTPAKDGADRWDAVDTVDLSETERVINRLIGDGVNGLIVLGGAGDGQKTDSHLYWDYGAWNARGGAPRSICRATRRGRYPVGLADVAAPDR